MFYIIKSDYFLTEYLMDALKDHKDICLIPYKRSERGRKRCLKNRILKWKEAFHSKKKSTFFFDEPYLQQLSQIKPDDQVLFFGVHNLKEILISQKFIHSSHLSVFLWNPAKRINRNLYSRYLFAHKFRTHQIQVYTFDQEDASRYRFHLVPQVYRPIKPAPQSDTITSDLFFIGQNKGRSQLLEEIKQIADSLGINYYFYIQQDKHSKILPALKEYMQTQPLPYSTVLNRLSRSKCLIEILQQGQSGYTLRTLEALFLQKKLITNNRNIRQAEFYHPDNIFIWGEDDPGSLPLFLQSPFHSWNEELYHKYDITFWIQQFYSPS